MPNLTISCTGLQRTITLNDGHVMPMFGLGLFGSDAVKSTTFSLQYGYRLLDTALMYKYVNVLIYLVIV